MHIKNLLFISIFLALVIIPLAYVGAITNPDPPKLTNATVGTFYITNYWSVPATHGGGGTLTYNITRSSNGVTFSNLDTTTSTSYVDSSPLIQNYGYYRIFSYDNGGQGTGYAFPLNQTISTNVRTHLPYDDVLTDQGKQDNTPSATGGTAYVTGHNGNARSFGGASYDTMANESNFDFERTTPFTISMWIKASNGQVNKSILSKANTQGADTGITIYTNGANVIFYLTNTVTTNQMGFFRTETGFLDNTWHHMVWTNTGSSNVSGQKLYIDGTSVSITTVVNNLSATILNNLPLVIAAESDGGNPITGSIDDLRIFYNDALDAHEVEQLYYERLDTANVIAPTTYNTPPTSLVASSQSATQIDLDWIAGTMTNVNGYRIERETPIGAGWVTILSNTTNTNLYYNNTALTSNIIYNYRVSSLNGTGVSTPSNEYDMTTFHLPDAVTDLIATAASFSVINLDWSAPTSYAPEITGYQINYTTPEGDPIFVITNNTGNTDTDAIATDLTIGDGYSFRVSAVTVHGKNATGNIANATTSTVFTLGNLTNPDVTNTNDFKIFFNRTDTNATSMLLTVTYPTSYDLACEFLYRFARINDTYTGLTETPISGPGADTDNVISTFQFNDVQNEIINVRCFDTLSEDEAKYIITITEFELLNQIENFRNGTYGTMGQFAGLDLITLFIIIIGMIGFNRVTPIAGVAFTVITVFVVAHFGIIQTYQIVFPALALIVLLAYARTRQSDSG